MSSIIELPDNRIAMFKAFRKYYKAYRIVMNLEKYPLKRNNRTRRNKRARILRYKGRLRTERLHLVAQAIGLVKSIITYRMGEGFPEELTTIIGNYLESHVTGLFHQTQKVW